MSAVDKIVEYFKTKPTGATLDDAKAALGGSAVDGRGQHGRRSRGAAARRGLAILEQSPGLCGSGDAPRRLLALGPKMKETIRCEPLSNPHDLAAERS